MKKLTMLIALLIIFTGYSLYEKSGNKSLQLAITQSPQTNHGKQESLKPTIASKYKDGAYSGSSENAFYGTIQVKIAITNGKLSNVSFLQYPHDSGETIEVNTQAMPLLKQEAIQAQNANVSVITGATQTSEAFQQSLNSALSKSQ